MIAAASCSGYQVEQLLNNNAKSLSVKHAARIRPPSTSRHLLDACRGNLPFDKAVPQLGRLSLQPTSIQIKVTRQPRSTSRPYLRVPDAQYATPDRRSAPPNGRAYFRAVSGWR